jgi:hypothetical protein
MIAVRVNLDHFWEKERARTYRKRNIKKETR